MTKKDTEEAVLERTRHRLRTTGLEAAVEALIGVCQDKAAPAPAKATAGVAIMRANGLMLDKSAGAPQKSAAEMTPEELTGALDALKGQLAALGGSQADSGDENDEAGEGVFD
ncbi:MAG: hypothetical protein E5X67_29895 [Mesorhizobium sp.]|uniref:hypothetical protein n=1 Tax=Mesorhizobium sp. TaxID=1871066 RepID=UPI00121412D4|nr:hypothetical protein [Mesorhizobium sp.]TIP24261.1 MAG: hypothetical protein E5X67_29895 [Mesorhizobium sp.]